jgi:hypothetical protein
MTSMLLVVVIGFWVCLALVRSSSSAAENWALQCDAHGRSMHSQGNQDGILEYVFENVGTTNKFYVEFGFNSPVYHVGTGSNTYNLYHHHGWRGLLLDGGFENEAINLRKEWITSDNIVSLLEKYDVPSELDYLSIDIDSSDLWILHAILSSRKYRPRVFSVEYNSNLPMNSFITCLNTTVWNEDMLMGASFGALQMVGQLHGYSVVAVVKYLDIIFVRNDLLRGSAVPRYSVAQIEGPSHAPSKNYSNVLLNLADFAVWFHNGGDLERARAAAASNEAAWENLYRIFINVTLVFTSSESRPHLELVYVYNYTAEEVTAHPERVHKHFDDDVLGFCKVHALSDPECKHAKAKILHHPTSATLLPDNPLYRAVHGFARIDEAGLPPFIFKFEEFMEFHSDMNIIVAVYQEDAIEEFDRQLRLYSDKYQLRDEWRLQFRETLVRESGTLFEPGKFDVMKFVAAMRDNWKM